MKIELKEITIRELTEGYQDNEEDGVVGYGGKLDIRPPYQREFIYKIEQQKAVIDTVTKNFPLNVMYWAVRDDGTYEVIDGQQRILSICEYVAGHFSYNDMAFHNLQDDAQDKILDEYKLMVYFCSGTNTEKLDWFETINIAGEELTQQELNNAVFVGSWVSDARRYFSKRGCAAYAIGNKYISGKLERQDYLETAIKWINNGDVKAYMSEHQHDPNANKLWQYFSAVITWVTSTFPKYRPKMKGVDWGSLYNQFKDADLDNVKLEVEIAALMQDDDVNNKSGIYYYVLTRKERYLNIRLFTDNQKIEAYERQKGICSECKAHFEINQMEGDHITPWHEGGKTTAENCQMLCRDCNRHKSGK